MGSTRVFIEDPCSFGLHEIVTVAHRDCQEIILHAPCLVRAVPSAAPEVPRFPNVRYLPKAILAIPSVAHPKFGHFGPLGVGLWKIVGLWMMIT